jgi:hypothetical protein
MAYFDAEYIFKMFANYRDNVSAPGSPLEPSTANRVCALRAATLHVTLSLLRFPIIWRNAPGADQEPVDRVKMCSVRRL